jgi:hypothetical protein
MSDNANFDPSKPRPFWHLLSERELLACIHFDLHLMMEGLKQLLEEHCKPDPQAVTKQDLQKMEERIMSQITDWAATEQASLDAISSTLDGIVTGIAALDALITQLQNSPGTLSAADQAALDAIQASSQALVAKSGAIAVTPPVTPVV